MITRKKRLFYFYILALFVATCEAIFTATHLIDACSSQVFSSVNNIPSYEIRLILGASEYSNGRLNTVLEERIQAAADLYFAGKVKMFVVSGISHPEKFNDETAAMLRGLTRRGVPQEESWLAQING